LDRRLSSSFAGKYNWFKNNDLIRATLAAYNGGLGAVRVDNEHKNLESYVIPALKKAEKFRGLCGVQGDKAHGEQNRATKKTD